MKAPSLSSTRGRAGPGSSLRRGDDRRCGRRDDGRLELKGERRGCVERAGAESCVNVGFFGVENGFADGIVDVGGNDHLFKCDGNVALVSGAEEEGSFSVISLSEEDALGRSRRRGMRGRGSQVLETLGEYAGMGFSVVVIVVVIG